MPTASRSGRRHNTSSSSSASSLPRSSGRLPEFASSRPDPGGGFGGKGWPKFEPLMAVLALRLGRPVRLVLTLEETFQQARRTSARIHAKTGFDREGRIVSQELQHGFPDRRVCRHWGPRRQQSQLRGMRAVSHAERKGHRTCAAVAHDAEHGVSRFRHAAGIVGGRKSADRSRRSSGNRPGRNSPTQSAVQRRSVHPQ